jgi:hypothetical protein
LETELVEIAPRKACFHRKYKAATRPETGYEPVVPGSEPSVGILWLLPACDARCRRSNGMSTLVGFMLCTMHRAVCRPSRKACSLRIAVTLLCCECFKMADVAPCSLVKIHRRCRGAYCLRHLGDEVFQFWDNRSKWMYSINMAYNQKREESWYTENNVSFQSVSEYLKAKLIYRY